MRFFKLAIVSALALGIAAPAFAQNTASMNSTNTPVATAKASTDVTPVKPETKSTASNTAVSKSDTAKNTAAVTTAAKTTKTVSLHKVSHKKHTNKKTVGPSASKT